MASKRNDLFKRLTQLFKGGPSVKRKVRAFRTPSASTAVEVFKKSYSQVYSNALNAYGQYDRMSRYADFCFSGNDQVYTTRGVKTFKELYDEASKLGQDEFRCKVYSYDRALKRTVIADAHSPRIAKNGEKQQLVRVTFEKSDNETGYVDVTLDHKFILRDGTEVEAQFLTEGTALMPFLAWSNEKTGCYTYIHTGDFSRWKNGHLPEHTMIMEHFIGRQLAKDEVVHHKDFDKRNNLLENLQLMTRDVHSAYHSQLNNVNKFGVPNASHSEWMRNNSQNRRQDITFELILSVALELDFHAASIQNFLNADANLIHHRLVERGFKNWKEFKQKKGQINSFLTRSSIHQESKSPSMELIVERAPFHKSLRSICSEFSCSTQAIHRRLRANGFDSWTAFHASLEGRVIKVARRGPKADPSVKFQDICDAYKPGMSQAKLGEAIGSSKNKVLTCIMNNGFRSYSEFTTRYQNHKVVSVERIDDDIVYNITVEKYHNLAVGQQKTIIDNDIEKKINNFIYLENSEMEYTPEISSALDIYSEESTSVDDKQSVLHVYSENPKIHALLSDLCHDVINAEHNLTPWTRNLCKHGDFFLFLDVHPEMGIINVFPMPVNEVERDEGWDPNNPLAVRFKWVSQGNQILESWQVAHFRLMGNDAFLPYGSSVLESGRRIWRQLILIEDAMLVYRVVRSPERRVFYIDVGTVPTDEIPNYMEAAQSKLKRSPVIDKQTGRIDLRYNPLSVDEDYFIPIRGNESGTKIDTLAGGQHVSDIADVEYIQKKLFAALKVPRAYLGYDESLSSKATLAQEDIRFSRSVSRIQRVIISELEKMCIIHLFAHGYEGEDLTDFSLFLSNPSTVAQMQKLELWRTKFEIAGTVPEGLTDRDFIRKEIFQLSDDQIDKIKEGRRADRLEDLELEASELEGNEPPGGGGGGGGGLGGLGSGGLSGEEDLGEESPETGGSEDAGSDAAAPEAGGKKSLDLFAGAEDESDGGRLLATEEQSDESEEITLGGVVSKLIKDKPNKSSRTAPAKTTPLSKFLYNRGRVKHHGAMKTQMPDFQGVLDVDNDAYDKRFFRAGPFGESISLYDALIEEGLFGVAKKGRMSSEMKHVLSSLGYHLDSNGGRRKQASVLTESEEEIDVTIEDDAGVDVLDGIVDFPLSSSFESES